MPAKAKSLPRGAALEVLDAIHPPSSGSSNVGVLKKAPRSRIEVNPWQHRRVFSQRDLNRLARVIYRRGLRVPLKVREKPGRPGWYQIIDGERTFRATEPRPGFVGLEWLDILVQDATDEEMGDLSFILNSQQVPHSPAEEVDVVKGLVDRGLNASQIVEHMGETYDWVNKRMKLARSLKEDVEWMLLYPDSITYAEETNKLTGDLRKKVNLFVRSRAVPSPEALYANEQEGDDTKARDPEIKLSVKEFRDFVKMHGGSTPSLRTDPAPQAKGAKPLPGASDDKSPRQSGYTWEEDKKSKAQTARHNPVPDIYPSAVLATLKRVHDDAELLPGYIRLFYEDAPWTAQQLDDMLTSIGEVESFLAEAREYLETAAS